MRGVFRPGGERPKYTIEQAGEIELEIAQRMYVIPLLLRLLCALFSVASLRYFRYLSLPATCSIPAQQASAGRRASRCPRRSRSRHHSGAACDRGRVQSARVGRLEGR